MNLASLLHRTFGFESFRANLPTWHRYWRIRRQALGLDRLHVYDTRATLTKERRRIEAALAARFERAKKEGDLPADAKPAELARYVYTVCNGLSVQAVGGATREQLRRVVEMAMRGWPG